MTEPAHAPGWYPDPHARAELRWHDGTTWTEHTHGAAAGAAAPPGAVLTAVPAAQAKTSKAAIWALVTGLLGVAIVPTILGAVALRNINRARGSLTGQGLAIAGIILGVLNVLVFAILLAVAIPTFLAQKDAALSSKAKASVLQVASGVESCAAATTDGTYTGCDAAGVAEAEPAVSDLLDRCGSPGGVCVELEDGGTGYSVSGQTVGPDVTTFTATQSSDGTRSRTCDGPACATGSW